ncbi:MAG TPA: ABC transporter ATP-binding protein [Devosia sp.]|jgi:oligopeptide/dipeptide ABC transporter ATP-binding protein|nr:ABC transporter ATP-binding protein [Devosia sp.]
MDASSEMVPLVSVRKLRASLGNGAGASEVLRGVSLDIAPGEILGLVGESGSGKTMTALSMLRLLPPAIEIRAGSIDFAGRDLLALKPSELQAVRGGKIAMIFQDPVRHLNPVFTVGQQLEAVIKAHSRQKLSRADVEARAIDLLDQVKIVNPKERLHSYPHQFSGGMAQRVMIALALAGSPDLLLADEPTSALDVTVQAEILLLLRGIARQRGMAILFISHNLGAVWQLCDRVCVMYAGQVVEDAATDVIVSRPRHPYTRALIGALPRLDLSRSRLANIPGAMPLLNDLPGGCAFHPRCPLASTKCAVEAPALRPVGTRHLARCHYAENVLPITEAAR